MRILIDIGHPAHVHLFKQFAWQLQKEGHSILFSVREKNVNVNLLQYYGFEYIIYGKSIRGFASKLIGLFKFNVRLYQIVKRFKPDISISHSSFYLSQICCLLKVPNITLEDTGNIEQVILYRYFTNAILTSSAFHKDYGKKQINYNGYHELAYLHPKHFTPNNKVLKELELNPDEKFALLRFISWSASHDISQKGISIGNKIKLIEILNKANYKILISSEDTLDEIFMKYQLKISPEKIHDLISFADIYIGEGATMASECAMLGTPTIYVNSIEAGTIDEQEKQGLLFHLKSDIDLISKVKELIHTKNLKATFKEKKENLLKDKIDVTAFMVWFVENWPKSKKIMQENPDYQYNFR